MCACRGFCRPSQEKPPSRVPSDPFRLAPPYPNRCCWAGHLDGPACQDGVPRTSIFPRSKVLSAPLPLTPPQSNKTLPGPIHSFTSCSSPSHLIPPTSPISSSTTSSKVERKVRQPRPHLTFPRDFPSSPSLRSQPPPESLEPTPPPLPDFCFLSTCISTLTVPALELE